MATVLCNVYTKLTAIDCNDKWSSDATLRAAARNNTICWRCGDGLVDPDEVRDEYSGARRGGCAWALTPRLTAHPHRIPHTPRQACDPGPDKMTGAWGCSMDCKRVVPYPPPGSTPTASPPDASPPSPPPPTPVPAPAPNSDAADYCKAAGGATCQNCGGTCSSADDNGRNSEVSLVELRCGSASLRRAAPACSGCAHTLPTVLPQVCHLPGVKGGLVDKADQCEDPNNANGHQPMLYTTSVWVTQNSSGKVTYVEAGKATLFFRHSGRVTLTVQMKCPWMIWSTPTSSDSPSDFDLDTNQKVQISYQTKYATDSSLQFIELNHRRKGKFARSSDYYTW